MHRRSCFSYCFHTEGNEKKIGVCEERISAAWPCDLLLITIHDSCC